MSPTRLRNLVTCDAEFANLLDWCREQDLNLHAFRHTVLSRARLPIPPPRPVVNYQ